MKQILLILALSIAAVTIAVTVHAQTTNAAPVAQLNAADVASINNLLPLLPPAWQPAIIKLLAIVASLGVIGRVIIGWRNGGLFGVIAGLFGGTNTPKTSPPASSQVGSALRNSPLLVFAILILPACLLFTGCKDYQAIEAMTGSGVNLKATVPIPYSGGQTLLGVSLQAGTWKNGTILQPTSTNALASPSVAIRSGTAGNANVNGQTSIVGTNATAGIGANGNDTLDVLTGTASDIFTNGLTTGK